MRRRSIIAVLAAALALLGTVLIVSYVRSADERALENQQPLSILVVSKDIPAGTPARELADYVQARMVPKSAVVPGAVPDLSSLKGDDVTSTTLVAGEQVLSTRFTSPANSVGSGKAVIPPTFQQVSIELEPQRVVGAALQPGDLVGVYASAELKEQGKADGTVTQVTDVIAHKVLVVRAQGSVSKPKTTPAATASSGSAGNTETAQDRMPDSVVIVTLAVDTVLAERIIFSKEFCKLWLTLETPTTATTPARQVNANNIYQP